MDKTLDRAITIVFLLLITALTISLIDSNYKDAGVTWNNQKPISLPEEIYLAEQGDTLIVSKVTDSIYIEFK